jgi:hypothetical protein
MSTTSTNGRRPTVSTHHPIQELIRAVGADHVLTGALVADHALVSFHRDDPTQTTEVPPVPGADR